MEKKEKRKGRYMRINSLGNKQNSLLHIIKKMNKAYKEETKEKKSN